MEYVYAALILNESDEEVNEENITARGLAKKRK